jgi:integrase
MAHSTLAQSKPKKPTPDFPLFAHASGRWAKKVRQRLVYFGKWTDDPKGVRALERWLEEKDDLLAGRTPRVKADSLTLHTLCNRFLAAKEVQQSMGRLTRRAFLDYHGSCTRLLEAFGKTRAVEDLTAADFESLLASLSKRYGLQTLGAEVQRVRCVFKYGYDVELLQRPVKFGPLFVKPTKRELRLHRHAKGQRMFTAAQIREILRESSQPLRAMIMLAVNCGFGNHDCGTLPLSDIDLDGGWIRFPRPKTGVMRTCPLWDETIAEIRDAISRRPKPATPEAGRYVFITQYGAPWGKKTAHNPVSTAFKLLLVRLGMYRPGLSFYTLRHVFQTIADEAKDPVATKHLMGHADQSMSDVYRERISDERLVAVVQHVHAWLFPRPTVEGGAA